MIAISDTIVVDFSKTFDNVICSNVETVDQYRKERPYKLFRKPGQSRIDCHFQIYELPKIKEVRIEVNHCRTTLDAVINILVNDNKLKEKYGEAPRDNFAAQKFDVPLEMCQQGLNIISFHLDGDTPGAYWLSDLTVEMAYQ